MHSVEHADYCPEIIKTLPNNATAILCEFQAEQESTLQLLLINAMEVINKLPLLAQLEFSTDSHHRAKLWKLRKGMYPSVAAVRAKGTTAMLEDVAVPLECLGPAVTDLQALFLQYGYSDAIIFGHAKEGNLHFLVTQPVNSKEDIQIFEAFNKHLAELIIHKYNGSLKAEHGTGRQIAPFVKDEWGEAAYEVMQKIKNLVDPQNILNPGVIINADTNCHLKNIKSMPIVEEEVDKCVECGYCEQRCPSKNYTLTPRQRIQIRRSLQRLKKEGNKTHYAALQKEFVFSGIDTCAVDGMCATDCPVNINTGELIKRLRRENNNGSSNQIALWVAKNFGIVESIVNYALQAGQLVNRVAGKKTMFKTTKSIKQLIPSFPLWMHSLTQPIQIKAASVKTPDIVYFPSCITRMMGADQEDKQSIDQIIQTLCSKASLQLFIAEKTSGVCCGQLFSSKGFLPAYTHTVNQTIEKLWQWTNKGAAPVLMDVTSCTHSLQGARPYLTPVNQQYFDQLVFLDSIDFAADYLLPNLTIKNKKQRIVFHPVCSVYKMNLMEKLKSIGETCAQKPEIPVLSACCGMAGDRGFYYPGLTACATKAEVTEVEEHVYDGYYSSGKTCEMALSEASQKNYQSLFYLLNEVS